MNLIPYNPHAGSPYESPRQETVDRFRDILQAAGIQTITRERRGADIRAACGQLCADAKEKLKIQKKGVERGGLIYL